MSVTISITNKYVVEDPIVTVKCRTAIKVLFLYIKMCLRVMLNSCSFSFTSISFLTNVIRWPEVYWI